MREKAGHGGTVFTEKTTLESFVQTHKGKQRKSTHFIHDFV